MNLTRKHQVTTMETKKYDISNEVDKKEAQKLLKFIKGEWNNLIRNSRNGVEKAKNQMDILYLPFDYIVPSKVKFNTMFYWDSYFIIQGLKVEARKELIKNIVDNCLYEVETYGRVLNANKKKWSTRSQMPYLTLMIKEVYDIYGDKKWLDKAYGLAKKEHKGYWMDEFHLTPAGFSRFYDESGTDEFFTHPYKSIAEASWDRSPRFSDSDIDDLAPIDLNCNLCRYEEDFSFFAELLGKRNESAEWKKSAEKRKKSINELMWNKDEGLFFDFNFRTGRQKKIRSLASYQALFTGLADKAQAEKMRDNLKLFQTGYGLAACAKGYGSPEHQWNWPTIWAPLQYICHKGLKDYDFGEEAKKIARQFICLVYENWVRTGKIWEKYNGESGSVEESGGYYPTQSGFAWTNAVTEVFIKEIYKI